MKLTKSQIKEIIKEVLSEKVSSDGFPIQYPKEFQANKVVGAKSLTKPTLKKHDTGFTAFVKNRNEEIDEMEEVEEAWKEKAGKKTKDFSRNNRKA